MAFSLNVNVIVYIILWVNLLTKREEKGVQKPQNSVNAVYEWPLIFTIVFSIENTENTFYTKYKDDSLVWNFVQVNDL